MRNVRKLLAVCVVFSLVFSTVGPAYAASPKPKITQSPTLVELTVGTGANLQLDVVATGVPNPTFSISPSSQGGITASIGSVQAVDTATVNAKILINGTPSAAGTFSFTVTAQNGKGTDTATISVSASNPSFVPVKSITVSPSPMPSLHLGETALLTYTISPTNATNKLVTWNSDNPAAATVDGSGRVTAVAKGSAVITATTQDGGKTATSRVQVDNAEVHYNAVKNVALSLNALTLNVGDSRLLVAKITPASATNQNVVWSTSDPSVTAVTAEGLVAALSPGTATITVTTPDGPSATCVVTVNPVTIPVSGISVAPSTLTLYENATGLLTYTINPTNATNKVASWSSNNTAVATVDPNGQVRALSAGSATITATTQDGGKTSTCAVTVQPAIVPNIPVVEIAVNPTSVTLNAGDTKHAVVMVTPPNATDQTVSWSTSNPSVATVSTGGLITAVSVGSAMVTATTNDGGKTATCSVTVLTPAPAVIPVSGISLANPSITLDPGSSVMPMYTIDPADATNKVVSWSSSNPSVATVDNEDGLVTAVSPGTATITVTTQDGGKTATYVVTVNSLPPSNVPVSGITIDPASLSLDVGQTRLLSMTISPANATDQEMYWSSSNGSVASITDDGVVSAISPGTATITATTRDGNLTDACVVTVNPVTTPVGGVSVSLSSLTIHRNTTALLSYTINPVTASNKLVNWSSSNTSVATVDADGLVRAISEGSTGITATTQDGGKKAVSAVTVISPLSSSISVTGLTLDPSVLSLDVGGTKLLAVAITPSNATNQSLAWTTSDASVAAVTTSGLVVALTPGTATITATTQDGSNRQATCAVTVSPAPATRIPVGGVTVSSPTATLTISTPLQLVVAFNPSNASDKVLFWSSSNTNVAVVDSNGLVTPIGPGTATITGTTRDGGFQVTTVVTVQPLPSSAPVPVPVSRIDVFPPNWTMDIGATKMLMYTITPITASNKGVTWTSSNPDVANVDSNGLVTARAWGYTLITATTADGGKTSTCSVVVSRQQVSPIALQSIAAYPPDLSLDVGGSRLLVVEFTPDDATDQGLSYSSDNPAIATVDGNGLIVARAKGSTTIHAIAHDGGKQAACSVVVNNGDTPTRGGGSGGCDAGFGAFALIALAGGAVLRRRR